MVALMDNIVAYLDVLEHTMGLSVSVHFSHKKLRWFPERLFSMLLPYNVHKNPYCTIVKKEKWQACICEQQNILRGSTYGQCFCRSCHAGVKEYIYRIYEDGETAGFIAVSGYRGYAPGDRDETMWRLHLSDEEIPVQLLDAVIPPLGRMFELLFQYPQQEDSQEPYNLILQFLHERQGQITLDEVCECFGRSKSYISHMFKKKCGMSLPAYCNAIKLDYARVLLEKTQIPITEIAFDAGYNDVSYFIVRFKEKFGETPRQYRKTVAGKMENRKII